MFFQNQRLVFVIDLDSSYYLLWPWHHRKLLILKNYAGKKQYKMWVQWVYLISFSFPLRVLLRPLKAVPEANLTFLGSLHFLIYLRSLFKFPTCKMWQLENSLFSKLEVLFPRTNLAANRDKILYGLTVFAVHGVFPLDDISDTSIS